MCLIIKINQEMLIADKNIPAFKTLKERNISVIFPFYYRKGKVNKRIELCKSSFWGGKGGKVCEIHEGYHSRMVNFSLMEHEKSHLFVIPKGAAYYIGGDNVMMINGYVSSTIIFVGKNTWFNRFMAYLKYGVVYK